MTRLWKKLGQIYLPQQGARHPKLVSHAANPLPIHLENNVFRVFFAVEIKNRSSVGAVDIDILEFSVVKEHYCLFSMDRRVFLPME